MINNDVDAKPYPYLLFLTKQDDCQIKLMNMDEKLGQIQLHIKTKLVFVSISN